MASTINADNGVLSGSAGLKHYSDTSGNLEFQTNGITAIWVDAHQKVTLPGSISANFAGGSNNRIIVQTAANVTGFLPAPAIANTFLTFNGVDFAWGNSISSANTAIVANSVAWPNVTGKPTFATVATTGAYSDLTGAPAPITVPTNVSTFTNDSGYLTATGTISKATNLANGAANSVVVQSASNTTTFLAPPSTANSVLIWTGSSVSWGAPAISSLEWSNIANTPNTIAGYNITNAVTTDTAQIISGAKTFNSAIVGNLSGSATNIAAGTPNQIVYQTAANTTSFVATPTTSSTFLQWNGTAFTWATAGATTTDDNTTNATYYPVLSTVTSGMMTNKVSSTKFTFNPSTGTLSATVFNSLSDVNSKKNIVDLEKVEEVLRLLRGGAFDFIDGDMHSSGYIAQELQKLIPHAVTEIDGKLTVNYAAIMPYISEGWKRHDARLTALEGAILKLSK